MSPPWVIESSPNWDNIYFYSNKHPSFLLAIKYKFENENYLDSGLTKETLIRHLASESEHSSLLSFDSRNEAVFMV